MADYTPNEMMTVAAARALRSEDVCFVGIGAPSAACNLARLTHAPGITLIYESGTIGTKPDVLPLSIGDPELCETALTTTTVVGEVRSLSWRESTTHFHFFCTFSPLFSLLFIFIFFSFVFSSSLPCSTTAEMPPLLRPHYCYYYVLTSRVGHDGWDIHPPYFPPSIFSPSSSAFLPHLSSFCAYFLFSKQFVCKPPWIEHR